MRRTATLSANCWRHDMCRRSLASIRIQLGGSRTGPNQCPILGAAMAEEIIHALDYDYGKFKLSKN